MFGKTKDFDDIDTDLAVEQFFGDEAGKAESVKVEELHHRVSQVESQISSQFTSMAAYAQIAQEQIETARSEASHLSDRTEQRMTHLIERERADRVEALGGAPAVPGASGMSIAPEFSIRLDALEASVNEIKHGLNECLARQKALADAITALFEPHTAQAGPIEPAAPADEFSTLPPPGVSVADPSEHIGGLSLN